MTKFNGLAMLPQGEKKHVQRPWQLALTHSAFSPSFVNVGYAIGIVANVGTGTNIQLRVPFISCRP